MDISKHFPYPEIRDQQQEAIDFALKALLDDDKRFVIIEAGTGVGKAQWVTQFLELSMSS